MSNSYFRFKQFIINQDRCAMKVCTDSCLYGASMKIPNEGNILDIGTGTGLLSLMAAQRSKSHIEAIEIDNESAMQARENFSQSAFSNQLSIINNDILQFTSANKKKYDCIISNPPFFENHLLSASKAASTAKHSISLSHIDLLNSVKQLLKDDGIFNVLLPYSNATSFIEKAKSFRLYPIENILVKNFAHTEPFRSILIFSNQFTEPTNSEIIIYSAENKYTEQATLLLKPFYFFL